MVRRFTRAVQAAEILGAVAAAAVLAILFLPRLTGGGNAASQVIEQPNLNVAVVPAADSAGFFIALHEGLFARAACTLPSSRRSVPRRSSTPRRLTNRKTGSISPAATMSATSRRSSTTTGASGPPRPAAPRSPPTWTSSPKAR